MSDFYADYINEYHYETILKTNSWDVVVSGQNIYDWKIHQSHKAREDKLNLTNEKNEIVPRYPYIVIVQKCIFYFRQYLAVS